MDNRELVSDFEVVLEAISEEKGIKRMESKQTRPAIEEHQVHQNKQIIESLTQQVLDKVHNSIFHPNRNKKLNGWKNQQVQSSNFEDEGKLEVEATMTNQVVSFLGRKQDKEHRDGLLKNESEEIDLRATPSKNQTSKEHSAQPKKSNLNIFMYAAKPIVSASAFISKLKNVAFQAPSKHKNLVEEEKPQTFTRVDSRMHLLDRLHTRADKYSEALENRTKPLKTIHEQDVQPIIEEPRDSKADVSEKTPESKDSLHNEAYLVCMLILYCQKIRHSIGIANSGLQGSTKSQETFTQLRLQLCEAFRMDPVINHSIRDTLNIHLSAQVVVSFLELHKIALQDEREEEGPTWKQEVESRKKYYASKLDKLIVEFRALEVHRAAGCSCVGFGFRSRSRPVVLTKDDHFGRVSPLSKLLRPTEASNTVRRARAGKLNEAERKDIERLVQLDYFSLLPYILSTLAWYYSKKNSESLLEVSNKSMQRNDNKHTQIDSHIEHDSLLNISQEVYEWILLPYCDFFGIFPLVLHLLVLEIEVERFVYRAHYLNRLSNHIQSILELYRHIQQKEEAKTRQTGNANSDTWITTLEKTALQNVLSVLEKSVHSSISRYKDFFPHNQPKDALRSAISLYFVIVETKKAINESSAIGSNDAVILTEIIKLQVDARYKKIAQLAEMESTENTPNLLTVHLFEASGIQNTRGITTRDPYCILSVNGIRAESQVQSKTCTPKWNQTFSFPLTPDQSHVLSIEMYDSDFLTSDPLLGTVEIPLVENIEHKNDGEWFYFSSDSSVSSMIGVRLQIAWEHDKNLDEKDPAFERIVTLCEVILDEVEQDMSAYAETFSQFGVDLPEITAQQYYEKLLHEVVEITQPLQTESKESLIKEESKRKNDRPRKKSITTDNVKTETRLCTASLTAVTIYAKLNETLNGLHRLCPGLELGHNPFLPFFYTPIESWITSLRDQAITQWLPEAIASDTWEPISAGFGKMSSPSSSVIDIMRLYEDVFSTVQGILQNDEKFNPNLFSLLSDVVTSYVTQLIQQVDVIASKFSPNFLLAKKEEAMTADEKMVVNKAIKGVSVRINNIHFCLMKMMEKEESLLSGCSDVETQFISFLNDSIHEILDKVILSISPRIEAAFEALIRSVLNQELQCPICEKPGLCESSLSLHIISYHSNQIHSKKLVCPICNHVATRSDATWWSKLMNDNSRIPTEFFNLGDHFKRTHDFVTQRLELVLYEFLDERIGEFIVYFSDESEFGSNLKLFVRKIWNSMLSVMETKLLPARPSQSISYAQARSIYDALTCTNGLKEYIHQGGLGLPQSFVSQTSKRVEKLAELYELPTSDLVQLRNTFQFSVETQSGSSSLASTKEQDNTVVTGCVSIADLEKILAGRASTGDQLATRFIQELPPTKQSRAGVSRGLATVSRAFRF